ncbi:MAG TPA: M48 family metalloprotease [Kofleriaceae bacterium]|nr:M48 family metalloprotease [Kofleriaceae bacterium]
MLRVVLAAAVLMLTLGRASAQSSLAALPKDPEAEKQFRADVAAVSAEAAAAYDEGNAARDADRVDDALAAYRRAAELASNVDHPHRRVCGVLFAKAQLDDAVVECEKALSLVPSSPYDKGALAKALMRRNRAEDVGRYTDLAREAAEAKPNDVTLNIIWCIAGLQSKNDVGFARCSKHLLAIDPNGVQANFFAVGGALAERDFDEAHGYLEKAKQAGLDQYTYDGMNKQIEEAEQKQQEPIIDVDKYLEPGLLTFCLWGLVMLVLFGVGNALSRATLRAVDRNDSLDATGTPRERRLHKIYKAVLGLAGLYFYLSLPLMIVAVIAAGFFALYVFEEIGAIPVYVIVLVVVMIFGTIIAVVRSLFLRREPDPRSERIVLTAYPKLHAMLDEVAAAIGTRPVDVVHLVPGTDIAVMERTGLLRTILRRPSERRLILGVAQFDSMTQLQLRAVLAHEYGHFRNEDTAGGGFAIAVRRSLFSVVERMAKSGANTIYNPVWWFLRGFWRMYLGISQGASRLQEVLADRWSIRAYGNAAFVAGYRHVVARTVEFDGDLGAKVNEVLEKDWSLVNLYDWDPEAKTSPDQLAIAVDKAMNREPSPYDSHPSPRQRIDWASRHDVPREPQADDAAPVWDLFPDPEKIERMMTTIVRENVQRVSGRIISDKDDAEEPEAESADSAS